MDSSGFGDPGKRVGRKKAAEKKNKQPRRGKGVAGLELEIWKENLKKLPPNYSAFHPVMKLHGHSYFPQPSFPDPVPPTVPGTIPLFGDSHAPIPTTVPGFLLRGFENYGQVVDSGSAGEWFSGQFQGDPFRLGGPTPMLWGGMAEEPSKEVTSIPNLGAFSDRCGICHKKKRDTSKREKEEITIKRENEEITIKRENEEDVDNSKEVEVVAVRRKGINGSGVVMEYEFFPAGRGSGSGGGYRGEIKMKSEASPTSSSCVTTNASGSGSGSGGYDSMKLSNSVDLSLKLSL